MATNIRIQLIASGARTEIRIKTALASVQILTATRATNGRLVSIRLKEK
jgi:hypothetical protein